jgi:hypothetical protein
MKVLKKRNHAYSKNYKCKHPPCIARRLENLRLENLQQQGDWISSVQPLGHTRQTFYLGMKGIAAEAKSKEEFDVVMGTLDVRDAFLQVEQDDPVLVYLQGEPFVIKRNLPGQRLGAKQWFLCLKAFFTEQLGFTFCQEQPCLARTPEATIMIHVDGILFVGLKSFWNDVFLKKMKERFTVSHHGLKGVGSSIAFLRRKIP